jgi:DNA segregation ATPase FtsK/SpoIIIE, S-DNA-T family
MERQGERQVGLFNDGATAEFVPPARLNSPECETADLVVAAPKEVARPTRTNPVLRLLPVVTALATVAVLAMAIHARLGVMRNPAFMLFPVMMLVSAIATVVSGADRRGGEIDTERTEYLSYLSGLRAIAINTAAAQHYSMNWCYPDPDALWTLVGGCRMWERRASAADFCHVRVGIGTQRLAGRLVAPTIESAHQLDPVTVSAMKRFVEAYSTVADVPIAIELSGAVSVVGEATRARALVRGMICHLAVMHSPKSVLIAAVVTDRSRSDWDWLKWLPHNRHPRAYDDLGPVRLVYPSLAASKTALAGVSIDQRLMVVVDDGADGITLLSSRNDENSAPSQAPRLRITGNKLMAELPSGEEILARPDQMSQGSALMCAQRLAGYRAGGTDAATVDDVSWQDLVGIGDLASYSPTDCWTGRRPCDRLRVPIGTTAEGVPVELDIKEAAEHGMGPHGLCVGATGSGKSELLRTVALGMIASHSPEALNLVLIDFKGGATFAGLESAPHVAAVITNLSDKAALVTRMRDALTGEMNRRQEMLRAAGNLDGVAAYARARRSRHQLKPLPALFIIVDEFSELLSQHPDFADLFVAIGRLGRSLGMHLLLASQRLDEGRLRGLESHLSYRVCLKTLSINESRIVLGTPDAYELPGTPGAAYLRVGTDDLVRFQAAYVSGPCHAETRCGEVDYAAPPRDELRVRVFTTEPVGIVTPTDSTETDVGDRPTVLQTVIERLSGHGPRAHEVWLPPLGAAPPLDVVLAEAEPMCALTVPIGSVDRPFEQRRTPLYVDLSGAAGNVAVVGAPQSGKSTALRTLIAALTLTHDPRIVQFYCVDFGGGALASVRDWPHVGSVAGRADAELVRRMIGQIDSVVRSRETLFRDHGIESMAHYRQLKSQGDPMCDRFGDVFLVVDGWAGLRRESENLENSVTTIAAEGLSFGVHVVLSASRWAEIRPALRDQIGTRIELRLGDAADSELDRRRAQQVPKDQPGRGLSHDGLHMVLGVPRVDGNFSNSDLVEASAQVGEMLRRRHNGWHAPPIALLPHRVDYDSLVGRVDVGTLLGLAEDELRPVAIDFTQQLHLVVIGDSECGKTATLRTICRELLRTTNHEQCQLFVVDVRRSLLDVVERGSGRLGGYFASADVVDEAMPRLIEELRRRMPPPDVTATQLRTKSWWWGPEIYVVVDDYELVGNTTGKPLAALAEMLPHARDVGLHLLVARRSGGAARAMFEPLLAGLRDAGCSTLLMSGSPDEGLAIGSVRQSPMLPGRGTLITRRSNPQLVQVAWSPPE